MNTIFVINQWSGDLEINIPIAYASTIEKAIEMRKEAISKSWFRTPQISIKEISLDTLNLT